MEPILMTWPRPFSTIQGTTRRVMGQCFDIGIKHDVPFVRIAFVFLVYADYQSGIINEDIYRFHSSGSESRAAFAAPRSRTSKGSRQTSARYSVSVRALRQSVFYIPSVENQAVTIHGKLTLHSPLLYPEEAPVMSTVFLSISYEDFNVTDCKLGLIASIGQLPAIL